jgi:hypothetical protein
MRSESGLELFPVRLVPRLKRSRVTVPPEACCTSQLLHRIPRLVVVGARHREQRKLGFQGSDPSVGVKRVVRRMKQGRLGGQEILVAGFLRLMVLPAAWLLLLLEDLPEQLILGCQHLGQTGRWRWRWWQILLASTAIPLAEPLLIVARFPEHLQKQQIGQTGFQAAPERTDN